jgi:signal transduction histidine kinase
MDTIDNTRGGINLWMPDTFKSKILILAATTVVTVTFHYGWIVEPLFGHVHWVHAIHGRLCYIPIVIAATWFGLSGGLYTAGAISVLILPYVLGSLGKSNDFVNEIAEIVFYFAIAVLTGVMAEREFRARQKQQEAQLQIERSQKLSLVGQLAAGVAHEIKNPLASIKGAADILTAEDTTRTDREEFKEILQNEVKRIDSTVAEFLEFARPKRTKLAKFDLTKMITATLRQLEAHAKREELTIATNLQEGIFIDGDREKLHQMVLNLMLNSIQASPHGKTMHVSLIDPNSSSVQLVIADDGTGIADSDIEHIFEPFYTTKSSGAGLGLAIVQDIVDAHEGKIDIESNEGLGTTITVTLPYKHFRSTDEDSSGR